MSGADEFAVTATAYFNELQQRFCSAFEAFEPHSRFVARSWAKPAGHRLQGGGESRLLRGTVFEKIGVNVSHVWGVLPPEAHGQVAGAAAAGGRFTACGISLVAHMANPYVPAVHLNLRYLSTSRAWFGGGSDLTPTFPFDEDTRAFHEALRGACDGYRADAYTEYKAWCDRYFYLPHRHEPRGVGGIFFDDLAGGDRESDFAFVRSVGEAVLGVFPRIVALVAMMPVMYFYACLVGLAGGLSVSFAVLNMPSTMLLHELGSAVQPVQFQIGLTKSICFGAFVALSSCRVGLSAGRSAAEVGRAATSAVVIGIIGIIALDAVFAACANVLGV